MKKGEITRKSGGSSKTLGGLVRPVEEILSRLKKIKGIATGHGEDVQLGNTLKLSQQVLVNWRNRGAIAWKTLREKMPVGEFEELYKWAHSIKPFEARSIPLISYAGAGTLEVNEQMTLDEQGEFVLSKLSLPKGDLYALQVKGESMLPYFHENDIVIVCQDEHPKNGLDYVFVGPGGETWIKTYFKVTDGSFELRSHNHVKSIELKHPPRAFKILYRIQAWPLKG